MLCSTNPQTIWPDRSTLRVERAHEVWCKSKHIWTFNHWLDTDRLEPLNLGRPPTPSSLLSSCVVLQATTRVGIGEELGFFLCFILPLKAFSTIGSNIKSTVHKYLSLWVVFMCLMSSKSSLHGGIAQQTGGWAPWGPSAGALTPLLWVWPPLLVLWWWRWAEGRYR